MPRRARSPRAVFAAVFAAGLIVLLAFALLERREEAFTLGVVPAVPLAAGAGQTICQGAIDVPAEFDRAQVTLADGSTADGSVRDARSGRPLDAPVPEGSRVEVCVEGPVGVLGNATAASRSSAARLDGKPMQADLAVVFMRSDARSLAALVPDVLERASLFHGGWVKPWLLGLLALLLVTAFPLLLAAGLRESSR